MPECQGLGLGCVWRNGVGEAVKGQREGGLCGRMGNVAVTTSQSGREPDACPIPASLSWF